MLQWLRYLSADNSRSGVRDVLQILVLIELPHSIFYIPFIVERPNATTNCSKSHVINEGADLLCLCSAKDGSPPPTAAWFKDRTLIGDRGYGPVTLSLRNINREQAGVYNCTAKSYSLEAFQLVNLTVNCKYVNHLKLLAYLILVICSR